MKSICRFALFTSVVLSGAPYARAANTTHPNRPLRSDDLKIEVCNLLVNELNLASPDHAINDEACLDYKYVVTRQVTSESVVKMTTLLDVHVPNFEDQDCDITMKRVPGQLRVDVDGDLTQDRDRWTAQKLTCK